MTWLGYKQSYAVISGLQDVFYLLCILEILAIKSVVPEIQSRVRGRVNGRIFIKGERSSLMQ